MQGRRYLLSYSRISPSNNYGVTQSCVSVFLCAGRSGKGRFEFSILPPNPPSFFPLIFISVSSTLILPPSPHHSTATLVSQLSPGLPTGTLATSTARIYRCLQQPSLVVCTFCQYFSYIGLGHDFTVLETCLQYIYI